MTGAPPGPAAATTSGTPSPVTSAREVQAPPVNVDSNTVTVCVMASEESTNRALPFASRSGKKVGAGGAAGGGGLAVVVVGVVVLPDADPLVVVGAVVVVV